jgi:hypothetical protein
MKRLNTLLPLLALLLAALACNLPFLPKTETPPPILTEEINDTEPPLVETTEAVETEEPTEVLTEEPTEEITEVLYTCPAGLNPALAFTVEFCHPAAISTTFTHTLIPENPSTADMPPWTINPDMIEITLMGYPVMNQYHDPQVFIYPIADFLALYPDVGTTITNLQTLLATQPSEPTSIPFLPIYNAAQMMHAKVEYLSFRNGSGVRFITQYGQAALPINNLSAFYAFVGLTDDGLYLISATLPVNHPLFEPDGMTEPPEGWAVFVENYQTYIADMESNLSLQPPETFTPDISILDAMMSSFLIPADAVP